MRLTQTGLGIANGEELVTLFRVFGYFYTEHDGQAWSPYLKRNIPCQVWNDNKELSEKVVNECSIKSFNTKDLKDVLINFSVNDDVSLVVELQSCIVPKRVWDWAKGINEKKISKERKKTHFGYENGGQDLDEYICNEVGYNWKSTGVAFRLDGSKLPENEMKEVFDYFEWETN
jgi:undecaprenyl pyrophosphate synthase